MATTLDPNVSRLFLSGVPFSFLGLSPGLITSIFSLLLGFNYYTLKLQQTLIRLLRETVLTLKKLDMD